MLTPRLAREALRPGRRIVKVGGTREKGSPRALRPLPKGARRRREDAPLFRWKKILRKVRVNGHFITCLCVREICLLGADECSFALSVNRSVWSEGRKVSMTQRALRISSCMRHLGYRTSENFQTFRSLKDSFDISWNLLLDTAHTLSRFLNI